MIADILVTHLSNPILSACRSNSTRLAICFTLSATYLYCAGNVHSADLAPIAISLDSHRNAGLGYGSIPKGVHKTELHLSVNSGEIESAEMDDSGAAIWTKKSHATQIVTFEVDGLKANESHYLVVSGRISSGAGGGEGSGGSGAGAGSNFRIAIHDVDVDVDSENSHTAPNRTPSGTTEEDDVEVASSNTGTQHPGMSMDVRDDWAMIKVQANIKKVGDRFELHADNLVDFEFSTSSSDSDIIAPDEDDNIIAQTIDMTGLKNWTIYVRPKSTGSGGLLILTGRVEDPLFADNDPHANSDAIDQVSIRATALELTARNGSGEVATTMNPGTSEAPKTLLTGMEWTGPIDDRFIGGVINLVAFSDAELSEHDFDVSPVWTATVPDGSISYFRGVYITDERTESGAGIEVNFEASEPGLYTFECTVGNLSRTISVFVVNPHFTSVPEYLFANAKGRIPLEFEIQGAEGSGFFIETGEGVLFRWDVSYNHDNSLLWNRIQQGEDLGTFAPEWDDTESHNGEASAYKVTTSYQPFSDHEFSEEDIPAATSDLRIKMESVKGKLMLPDGEETNVTTLEGVTYYEGDVTYFDSRWKVVHIGDDHTAGPAFTSYRGISRIEHIASDDNNYPCYGYGHADDVLASFSAGADEKYANPGEKHYHRVPPRGFDQDWYDWAYARMQESMSADGCKIGARLFDDADISSDDEEEYVARILGAGIGFSVQVTYGPKTSGHFGTYYDLENTSGNVFPKVLPNSKWKATLSANNPDGFNYLNATINGLGLAAAIVGLVITVASGPPVWIFVVAVSGSVIGTAAVATDVESYHEYRERRATAEYRLYAGTLPYTANSQLPLSSSGNAATVNSTLVQYGENGVWSVAANGGVGVNVGDSIRTGFEIFATAQNISNEWSATDDVYSYVDLERTSGSHDLSEIEYTWP